MDTNGCCCLELASSACWAYGLYIIDQSKILVDTNYFASLKTGSSINSDV